MHFRKLGPPVVAATITAVVLSDFATVTIVSRAVETASGLAAYQAVWPITLTSDVAVILVMSLLYRSLVGTLKEVEHREQIAKHQAIHDELTGLGNRRLLSDRLDQALAHVRRGDLRVAVLMLDLDRFKQVNDTLGHGAGDALVQEVARRLTQVLRETDTLARVGGDEFVIIQSGPRNEGDVRRLCSRIIEAIAEPFFLLEKDIRVGVSIGAVMADKDSLDAEDLVRKADITMYRAKAAGRNCFRLFSDEMEAETLRRDQVQAALRQALEGGPAPDCHYQPVINQAGEITGVEALLRWTHPLLGRVPPSEVIPIAEESGLMDKLADATCRTAFRDAARWPGLVMAVNISPVLFRDRSFPHRLRQMAVDAGIPCERIEVEIMENLLLEHGHASAQVIKEIRSSGFKVSLDDFGTGYSSLSYLRRFRVDKVKLDRSFMEPGEFGDSREVQALVKGAVSLGHALGVQVVAEGIETREQEKIALSAGCDGLQGYRYSHALTADELDQLLVKRHGQRFALAA
jgi:diguanylate cyclase (GGDEF)-like protein